MEERARATLLEAARNVWKSLKQRLDAGEATMPEFVAWARSKRGQGNYASPGVASVHHLVSEMLLQTLGVEMVHIPGGRNLYLALMAGEVDAMFEVR